MNNNSTIVGWNIGTCSNTTMGATTNLLLTIHTYFYVQMSTLLQTSEIPLVHFMGPIHYLSLSALWSAFVS